MTHLKPVEDIPDTIQVDRLYTIDRAAELLDAGSRYILDERIKNGSIDVVNLDTGTRKKLRLRASTINQLIDELTVKANTAA